ncbi:MAG: HTTM domain-containing protein [Ignavibacteria bacterium]|nr:HTTM domain-containing protein [Ignavibacteria bacterium]
MNNITLKDRITSALFSAVSINSIVVFRISYGLIMLWEFIRYIDKDWIKKYYVDPQFHFTYEFFDWVKPWSGNGMELHFYAMVIFSLMIIFGLYYRTASVLMFLSFTYVFLLEQARYLNHFYLVVLVSFLMIFIPAGRAYSLDAMRKKQTKSTLIPRWCLILLQFQLGAAYFFGGIAKLNNDWLFLAEPLKHWLAENKNYPIIGQLFTEPWVAYFMSWNGMFLDILAPFLLLYRKTRPYMFAAILCFHFINDRLFSIGIFPWFMILVSTIFFPSDWFTRMMQVYSTAGKQRTYGILGMITTTALCLYLHPKFEIIPTLIAAFSGAVLVWLFIDRSASDEQTVTEKSEAASTQFKFSSGIVSLLALWVILQCIIPLRHFGIPGNSSWTEEGHRFSWHMKLRGKSAIVKFYAYDPITHKKFEIETPNFLKRWQADKMSTRPYMIHQYAQHLDDIIQKSNKGSFEIRAEAYVSMNYRPAQLIIDTTINLAKQEYSDLRSNHWILPLDESAQPVPYDAKESGEDNQNE